MKRNQPLPVARRKKSWIVQELPDEIIIYDINLHKAYYLNTPTATVWKHCNGKTKTDEMAHLLENELNVLSGAIEVQNAIGHLRKHNLVR